MNDSSRVSLWFRRAVNGLAVVAAAVVLGGFAWLMIQHRLKVVPEIDCQGYFVIGRAFSQFHWPRWPDDLRHFYGHVWVDVGNGQVMSKYPPGWPLLLMVGYWFHGLTGAMWVNPLLAIVGAVAFYLLAVELFNVVAAFVCTMIWLFAPMTPIYSLYPLTHGPDIACCLLAFLFAARWGRTRSVWAAGLAGFCAGFLPLLRPANILVWPAILVVALAQRRFHHAAAGAGIWQALVTRQRAFVRDWRQAGWRCLFQPAWRAATVGGLAFGIPVLFLAIYNWHSFGLPWRTGYYFTAEQTGFSFAAMGSRLQQLYQGRGSLLEERYWVLILLGLLFRPGRSGLLWGLLLWFVPMVLVHTGYYFFSASAMYYRFIISCVPACILAIGFLLSGRLMRFSVIRLAVVLGAAGWFWSAPPRLLVLFGTMQRGQVYTRAQYWADPQLALTGMLHHERPWTPEVTALRDLTRGQPGVVYASDAIGWTLGSERRFANYDVAVWLDPHFNEPMGPGCGRSVVWEDLQRHRCFHEWRAALGGEEGIRKDFLNQVHSDLAGGLAVWIAGEPAMQTLPWLRGDATLVVESTDSPLCWRVRPSERTIE